MTFLLSFENFTEKLSYPINFVEGICGAAGDWPAEKYGLNCRTRTTNYYLCCHWCWRPNILYLKILKCIMLRIQVQVKSKICQRHPPIKIQELCQHKKNNSVPSVSSISSPSSNIFSMTANTPWNNISDLHNSPDVSRMCSSKPCFFCALPTTVFFVFTQTLAGRECSSLWVRLSMYV